MAALPVFVFSIALPLIMIVMLAIRPRAPRAEWIGTLLLAVVVTAFSVLVAPWGVFGLPVRYGLIALFVAALVISLRRAIPTDVKEASPLRAFVKIMIALFFAGTVLSALQAHQVPQGAIDLAFPLRNGSYLILHGGSTSATNTHHADAQQRFAVDIIRVNTVGMRSAIVDAEVLSPCNGAIVSAASSVVVRCGDVNVRLEPLRNIAVRAGANVSTGQLVGRVATSGNVPEPHLHLHAERNGVAVPMKLSGEWWVRNELARK